MGLLKEDVPDWFSRSASSQAVYHFFPFHQPNPVNSSLARVFLTIFAAVSSNSCITSGDCMLRMNPSIVHRKLGVGE